MYYEKSHILMLLNPHSPHTERLLIKVWLVRMENWGSVCVVHTILTSVLQFLGQKTEVIGSLWPLFGSHVAWTFSYPTVYIITLRSEDVVYITCKYIVKHTPYCAILKLHRRVMLCASLYSFSWIKFVIPTNETSVKRMINVATDPVGTNWNSFCLICFQCNQSNKGYN